MIEQEETMKPTGSNPFKSHRSRLGRRLSEGLDKRLASYAAAAKAAEVGRRARSPEAVEVITRAVSAVGAGLLLAAGPASARIVYTPVYTPVGRSCTVSGFCYLDLNHDGIIDFKFHVTSRNVNSYGFRVWASAAQPGNAILGTLQGVLNATGSPGVRAVASALPAGHRIGPGSKFGQYQTMWYGLAADTRDQGTCSNSFGPGRHLNCGYWGNAQGRFLGFEFTIQGQMHFGWARLNLTSSSSTFKIATLTGYAYETEPNKPIRAGDTGPVADAREPEMYSAPPAAARLRPATLGLLALGSAGLDIWRKEQDQ